MSSPLLKFHQLSHEPLDTGVLAAAVEASPDPMALVENGKLIYTNRSFAQLSSFSGRAAESPSDLGRCRMTEFVADGRRLSLTTLRREISDLGTPDSRHQVIIGRLAGGVAHDFNNLLTGILLYCDLLQSKAESGSSLERKIAEIQSAAEQGAALIRQLMTLGREENGAPESVVFDQVVQDLESLLRHLLGEHIRFTVGLAQGSGLVGISLAQAQQIILARVALHLKLKTENRMLREKIKSKQGFGSIIGRAPEMDELYRIIAKAAHSIRCSFLARAVLARKWWRGRFITPGHFATSHAFRLTVARWCPR